MNIRQKIIKEEDFISRPIKDGIGIYGIVDNLGIDQLYCTDKKNLPPYSFLDFRCRLNTARNARIFCCIIKKKYIPTFEKYSSKELYEELKRRAISFYEDKK